MEEKIWFAVRITVDSRALEAVEFALNEAGALGTEIDILGKLELPEIVEIVGYFDEKPNEENLKLHLADGLRIYYFSENTVKEIAIREIENRDWLAEWKKHWRPTETARFIIAPTWEKFDAPPGKIVIRIEPSMAFGTGTHETTQLCLKAIEENYAPEMTFLDVGTGTGILAIAAEKLRVESEEWRKNFSDSPLSTLYSLLACDTDEDSIKIARENAELNDAGEIEFYVGSIDENTPPFDFVCANLTIDVILPILPLLVEKSKQFLVLSGILKEQENQIVEELIKLQIIDYKIETLGMWISVTVISEQLAVNS